MDYCNIVYINIYFYENRDYNWNGVYSNMCNCYYFCNNFKLMK